MQKQAILLVVVISSVLTLFLVSPTHASIGMPSVPEFTVKLEEHPYYAPRVYGVDEYTGANITIQTGQLVLNQTVTITIRNQPLAPQSGEETYYLYYNIRVKGHFGYEWKELFGDPSNSLQSNVYCYALPIRYLAVSNTGFTETTQQTGYSAGSMVDYQVEAIVWRGFQYLEPYTLAIPTPSGTGHYEQRYAFYAASGWSDTQTIEVPLLDKSLAGSSAQPINDQAAAVNSETIPRSWQAEAILGVLLGVIFLAVATVYLKKRKERQQSRSTSYSKYLQLEP